MKQPTHLRGVHTYFDFNLQFMARLQLLDPTQKFVYCSWPLQKGSSKLAWGTILLFIHARTHPYVYCCSHKGKNICQTNFA